MTITATYGMGNRVKVFTHKTERGTYYAPKGGTIVNLTRDPITQGVYIDAVKDIDCFTWNEKINSHSDLLKAIKA